MWLRSPIPVTIRPPVVTHQISEKRMNESQFIDALPAGTPISAYVIENELSSGGFGLVYLGHRHNKPDQKVAIKEFLPRDYARRDSTLSVKALSEDDKEIFEESKRKFLEETSMLIALEASVESPNLVKILGHDRANNTVYMIMELLPGSTLEDLIGNFHNDNDISKSKKILKDLLGALTHVHDRNIWHRDIKPNNIMFRDKNTPVLIDFGAARLENNPKVSKYVPQTPAYAAPEQVCSSGPVGPWTDIYSIAATFYHCLLYTSDAADE